MRLCFCFVSVLFLLSLLACGSDPVPASRTLAVSCGETASITSTYFSRYGFQVSPEPKCMRCSVLKTEHLQDADGHAVRTLRTAMRRYTKRGKEQEIFGAWYVDRELSVQGNLRLTEVQEGCRADLLFHYSWYAIEFLLVVPVDGDAASRPSNGRLEAEYLDRVAEVAKRP